MRKATKDKAKKTTPKSASMKMPESAGSMEITIENSNALEVAQRPISSGIAPVVNVNPEILIAKAIENNLPIDTMEKLLGMRRELKAEWSKERYFQDLAKFQKICPAIVKTKTIKDKFGKDRYSYTPLDSIVAQVKDALEETGFSYTIKTRQDQKSVTAICYGHHKDGHTEETEVTVPIDLDAYMNDTQKVGSAITYAKRYAFSNQFGIMTADADDDATSQLKEEADIIKIRDDILELGRIKYPYLTASQKATIDGIDNGKIKLSVITGRKIYDQLKFIKGGE